MPNTSRLSKKFLRTGVALKRASLLYILVISCFVATAEEASDSISVSDHSDEEFVELEEVTEEPVQAPSDNVKESTGYSPQEAPDEIPAKSPEVPPEPVRRSKPPPNDPKKPIQYNWAGNIKFQTEVLYPTTVEEVVDIVVSHDKVRVLGTGHSFNNVAFGHERGSSSVLISTRNLREVIDCCNNSVVRIQSGVTYADLGEFLRTRGLALPNIASLPGITVTGAASTATHGSGMKNPILASAVKSLTLVTHDGELRTFTRPGRKFNQADGTFTSLATEAHELQFHSAVVGLGAVGVVVEMEIELVPSFDIQLCIYENIPLKALDKPQRFELLILRTYSTSLFTDWTGDAFSSVWLKSKLNYGETGEPCESRYKNKDVATKAVHPIPGLDAEACSKPGVGPSHQQLPHFLDGFTPSNGDELQSEYFVSLRHWRPVTQALFKFGKQGGFGKVLQISEVRFLQGDDFTLSPCSVLGGVNGCAAFHFTWHHDAPEVRKVLQAVEDLLGRFDPLPHWGKVFNMEAGILRARYGEDRLNAFRTLLQDTDWEGKFENEWMSSFLAPPKGAHDEL
ncbi:hypothetical protein CYMTET_21453 [Cymbomonas tetramitiformis]|uniref:FAD-binding PCMH-type domain-containing protein n=1 Tax=Cymbomonas tetramitiformis TaxID=36881 RepID=A0AAE0G253_9CHLO|nr:hypothetical protein CYMTET_21453 [Cymbomonas tetramitiformis]|eukprot:gene9676-11471_t